LRNENLRRRKSKHKRKRLKA